MKASHLHHGHDCGGPIVPQTRWIDRKDPDGVMMHRNIEEMVCQKCGTVIGPASEGMKRLAGHLG